MSLWPGSLFSPARQSRRNTFSSLSTTSWSSRLPRRPQRLSLTFLALPPQQAHTMDGQGNEKLVSEATSTTGQVSPPAACLSCETYLHEDGRTRVSSSNLILFHVCKLRTGTKKEKADACIHLGKYAAASNDLRSQVLAAGGLASLIQAWPDAQFASAKAIAHAILGVDDAWVLLQFSRGILDALR